MNKYLMAALLSVCCFAPLAAQELVKLPAGDYICTVEVSTKQPQAEPIPGVTPPSIEKKRLITSVGNIRRDQITWSDSAATELWTLRAEQIAVFEQRGANGKKYPAVADGVLLDSVLPQLLRLDASSLSWIQPDKLQNKEAIGGSGPLHYKTEIVQQVVKSEEPGVPDTPARTVILQAWIDQKTLLPVRLDDGDAAYTLSFASEIPTGPLQIPEALLTELKRWKSALVKHGHL